MDHKYSTAADGVPGNDDFGTMSAWFLWAAAGLYPQAGSTRYILGSPLFPKLTIRPLSSSTSSPAGSASASITILAHNSSQTNVFVQRVEVNGRAVPPVAMFVDHSALVQEGGALLEFWMGPAVPGL